MNFKEYAGADWLKKTLGQEYPISTLGEVVADTLGLVYQGIYHIDGDVLRDKSIWEKDDGISLSIYGQLATYDFPQLTLLLLACLSQCIRVEISGSRKGYFKLTFWQSPDQPDIEKMWLELKEPKTLLDIRSRLGMLDTKREIEKLYDNENPSQLKAVFISYPCQLSFEKLAELVIMAHQSAVRVEVSGLSYRSLQIGFHKRDPKGKYIYSYHPSWMQAWTMYAFYGVAI